MAGGFEMGVKVFLGWSHGSVRGGVGIVWVGALRRNKYYKNG